MEGKLVEEGMVTIINLINCGPCEVNDVVRLSGFLMMGSRIEEETMGLWLGIATMEWVENKVDDWAINSGKNEGDLENRRQEGKWERASGIGEKLEKENLKG